MMKKIQYPQEKRVIMLEYGSEELREFAMKVPLGKLEKVLKHLPKVNGFRAGKEKEASRRFIAFFGKINRWLDKDWEIMTELWLLWTETHQFIPQALNIQSRKEIEELVLTMIDKEEAKFDSIKMLILAGHTEPITQGILRDWYEYGPFPKDSEVNSLIALAPSHSESALRPRLNLAEQKLKALENDILDLNSQAKLFETAYRTKSKQKAEIDLQGQLFQREIENQQVITKLTLLESRLEHLNKDYEENAKDNKTIHAKLGKLDRELLSIKGNMDVKINDKEYLKKYEELNECLKSELIRLENYMLKIESELKSSLLQALSTISLNHESELDYKKSNIIISQHARSQKNNNVIKLEDASNAIAHLEKNLNLLGIKLQHARVLAYEVLSALASGQLVTFSGSLSFSVAERCAMSLAGNGVQIVHIPVGLLEGSFFEEQLNSWLQQSEYNDLTISIILEGANRSALEIYGSVLRQLIVDRLLRLDNKSLSILLFATLVDGPSAIPYSKGYLEIGPIFDTDAFTWMGKSASPCILGAIQKVSWLIITDIPKIEFDWDESLIPQWLLNKGGALWRRTIMISYLFYNQFNVERDASLATVLCFGWIISMTSIIGLEKMNEVLDGIEIDDRSRLSISKLELDLIL